MAFSQKGLHDMVSKFHSKEISHGGDTCLKFSTHPSRCKNQEAMEGKTLFQKIALPVATRVIRNGYFTKLVTQLYYLQAVVRPKTRFRGLACWVIAITIWVGMHAGYVSVTSTDILFWASVSGTF